MDKQKDFEKGWEDYKTKRKLQTEEMIGIIQKSVGGCARNWASLIAEELIKYYQPKIPEDVVVLTREEYDEIKQYQSYIPDLKKAFDKIRKETAEKYHDRFIEYTNAHRYTNIDGFLDFDCTGEDILNYNDEIAKEITEGV